MRTLPTPSAGIYMAARHSANRLSHQAYVISFKRFIELLFFHMSRRLENFRLYIVARGIAVLQPRIPVNGRGMFPSLGAYNKSGVFISA